MTKYRSGRSSSGWVARGLLRVVMGDGPPRRRYRGHHEDWSWGAAGADGGEVLEVSPPRHYAGRPPGEPPPRLPPQDHAHAPRGGRPRTTPPQYSAAADAAPARARVRGRRPG